MKISPASKKSLPYEDFLIERLSILVKGLAKTFGPQCEVVLHDLRRLDKSVIVIENGHITGRKVGSSITNLGLRHLRENTTDDLLLNYKTTTKDGRTLKSTTVLFRNEKEIPIAALCVNLDITNLQQAFSEIGKLCEITEGDQGISETFENDITGTISSIIDNVMRDNHVTVPAMKKEDRMRIVEKLDEKGIFLIKGAIKSVARKLSISKHTIYGYLEELKSKTEK